MATPCLFQSLFLAALLPLGYLPAAERVALIIGNNSYTHGEPLRNPVNDARAVAAALAENGFETKVVEDGSHQAMEQAVVEFGRQARDAKAAWFYYSGHGAEVKGENYLVPVDAQVQEEFQVRHKTLALDQVLGALEEADPPLKVVVLDCCRNNPFGKGWTRSQSKGLRVVGETPGGTIMVFATSPGKVAAEGRGTNSPFTQALIDALARPGLDVKQVFDLTGQAVVQATGRAQQPWVNSSFFDTFILRPGTNTSAASLAPVLPRQLPVVALTPARLDAPYTNSLGMKFIPVPITGGPTDGKPVLFSVWETRVRDYQAYAEANTGVDASWKDPGFAQTSDHPVVMVSWEDANAFASWLTRTERAQGRIGPGDTYRLPSDHEWSCAVGIGDREVAHASPKAKDTKIAGVYPWGSRYPPPHQAGNYAGQENLKVPDRQQWTLIDAYDDGGPNTAAVGSFTPNRVGVYDLGGNVWEWCQEWYDPAEPTYRVLRGASWGSYEEDFLLSSYRCDITPVFRYGNFGFRLVFLRSSP